MTLPTGWLLWALLSACFAALTAIFAKIGIRGVDSDLATLVRTVIILFVLAPFVWLTGKWSNPFALPSRTLVFLALSAFATGASWVCSRSSPTRCSGSVRRDRPGWASHWWPAACSCWPCRRRRALADLIQSQGAPACSSCC